MSAQQQRLTSNGDRWWPFEECPGWLEYLVKNEDGTPKEGKHDPGPTSFETYTVSYSQKYKKWAIYENKKGKWKKEYGPGIPAETGLLRRNVPTTIDSTTVSDTPSRFTQSATDSKQEWAERDARKSAQIQKLHDETAAIDKQKLELGYKDIESRNKQTEAIYHSIESIDNFKRQVEDLSFIVTDAVKALAKLAELK